MLDNASRLGVLPVGKLLLKFSIPAITGMLVNALYNVVDRIFVGNGVGESALGGLSIAGPFMIVIMAFSMLFGTGTANFISIRLGEGKKEEAQKALVQCFFLLVGAAIVIMLAGQLFLARLLILFGGKEGSSSLAYAAEYMRIILYGSVFNMVAFGFSHCARAQGFPIITMIAMLIGAIMNIVLDPLFIFVFKWGVSGAAYATVLSQLASMCWLLLFAFRGKGVLKFSFKGYRPSLALLARVVTYGSAEFFLQLAASLVTVIFNYCLVKYGEIHFGHIEGGEAALAAFNIVNSVAMIILMPIFGINQGAQPILGYNYGAKQFKRVMKAYYYAVFAATCVSTFGFILTQLFSENIVRLFTPNGTMELLTFGPLALRRVLITLPIVGFQVVSSHLFIATGQPKISILLSMSRQVLVLIPCLLIFSYCWGINGIIFATPASDVFSTLLTAFVTILALKKMRNEQKVFAADN